MKKRTDNMILTQVNANFQPGDTVWYAEYPGNPFVKPIKGKLMPTGIENLGNKPLPKQPYPIQTFVPFIHGTTTLDYGPFGLAKDINKNSIIARTEEECIRLYNARIQADCDALQRRTDKRIAFFQSRMVKQKTS